jgi:PadR family transcriptional regulator PadR
MAKRAASLQTLRVLAVMLSDPTGPWYGAQLIEETGLGSGTLYPILSRLVEDGWLVAEWEEIDPHKQGRPRRRFYRLTGTGSASATNLLQAEQQRLFGTARLPTRPRIQPA